MKKSTTIEKITTETKVESITCNMCGVEIDCAKDLHPLEIHNFYIPCGYNSDICDNLFIEFELCDHCIMKLMSGFKHMPEIRHFGMDDETNKEIIDGIKEKINNHNSHQEN